MSTQIVTEHYVEKIASGRYLVTSGHSGRQYTVRARALLHGEALDCDCPGFNFRDSCSHCVAVRKERAKEMRVPDSLRVLRAQQSWNTWDGEPEYN